MGGRGSGGGKNISTEETTASKSTGSATKEELKKWSRMNVTRFTPLIASDEQRIAMLEKIPAGAGFNATYKEEDYFQMKEKNKKLGYTYDNKADLNSNEGKVYYFHKDGDKAYRVQFEDDTEKTYRSAAEAVKAVNKDANKGKKRRLAMSVFWKP